MSVTALKRSSVEAKNASSSSTLQRFNPSTRIRCSFGSLAENPCVNDGVWLTQNGSAWCEGHKPSWTRDLERIGSDPEMPVPGVLFNCGHRPANPSWCRSHFAR